MELRSQYIVRQTTAPEKMMPNNLEAEEAVLGACLMDPDAIIKAAGIVQAEDFYLEKNHWIYAAMGALWGRGDAIDYLSVISELERQGKLNDCGGAAYLAALQNAVPTALHVAHYAELVKRSERARRLIYAGTQVVGLGYNCDDIGEAEEKAQEIVLGIGQVGPSQYRSAEEISDGLIDKMAMRFANPGLLSGITTGYANLDAETGGMEAGLYVLAAPTHMGKTAFKLAMINRQSQAGIRIGNLSLEASGEDEIRRLTALRTGIPSSEVKKGLRRLGQNEWREFTDLERNKVYDENEKLRSAPLYFQEAAEATPAGIHRTIADMVARYEIQIFYVDSLNLTNDRGHDNRNLELGAITRALFGLSKKYGISVVLLAQLSREVSKRDSNHYPKLADLRDSGEIEQNADAVWFVHRKYYWDLIDNPKDAKYSDDADLIIAKDRLNGNPNVIVPFRYVAMTADFQERK